MPASSLLYLGWTLILTFSALPAASLNDDGLSLLALKVAVSFDPTRALHSWHESDHEPCAWRGVACRDGRVTTVSLANLSLEGYLPSELSLLSSLEILSLSRNRFYGPMPSSIGQISNLIALDLSRNNLSGAVTVEFGALNSLVHLDLSSNYLDGPLPPSIAALPNLAGVLNLSYNAFSGEIPSDYGNLPVVVSLDLRHNQLTGEIPEVGSLLSQGPTAFTGNPGLCGFPLKTQCSSSSHTPRQNDSFSTPVWQAETSIERRKQPSVMIPILAGIITTALVSVIVLQWQLRRSRASADGKSLGKSDSSGSPARKNRREEIYVAVDESFGLELEELLRASAYVIGKSRSGIVYKVLVGNGSPASAVAVRRLSEPEDDNDEERCHRGAFEAEATVIGRAVHPSLVRLRAYYYAPDERLLVYDYIPNGNLYMALHSGNSQPLPWLARLAILEGAARALSYLHERKYVHGNVKSSKILLDNDLRPYVSGFGITRLQRRVGGGRKATGGYLAPEMRKEAAVALTATQRGDVYAFGVLMMEVATGKKAEIGLEELVRRALREDSPMLEVADAKLIEEEQVKPQTVTVLQIALGCTEAEPEARSRMKAVLESLERIGPVSWAGL